MLKLYRKSESGVLEYHEAWTHDDEVTAHWGVVGERGQTETFLKDDNSTDDEAIKDALMGAVQSGFRPLDEESWRFLIIEYELESDWGDDADLKKRHRLEARMNETLGWTGIGHCDGGSIGSGTMQVCCVVADYHIAKEAISSDLEGTEFADYTKIYDESE